LHQHVSYSPLFCNCKGIGEEKSAANGKDMISKFPKQAADGTGNSGEKLSKESVTYAAGVRVRKAGW